MDWGSGITYFGSTTLKDKQVSFGIKDRDRAEHITVIGQSERGRAELLAHMALQDIARGVGVVVLDAGGELTELILERLDPLVRERLIFLDPSDGEYPFSWNPVEEFRALPAAEAHAALSRAIASVYRISASPLSEALAEHLLANTNATLVTVYDLVTDAEARAREFGADTAGAAALEALLAARADDVELVKEHGRYVAKDTLTRNVLGQTASKFSLDALATGAIVVVELSRIRMFPTRITPLTRILMHATRARAEAAMLTVGVYIHNTLRNLSEEDIDRMFSERRLTLTVSDTAYTEEDAPLREKALARSLSVIALSPSPADLKYTEKFFYPYIESEELEKLEEREFAVALAIDNLRSRPFFGKALPLIERQGTSYQDSIGLSRERYTMPRAKVDQLFRKKTADDDKDEKPKGKDGEGGSFSDTFRSIFGKRATAAAVPEATTEEKPAKEAPVPPAPKEQPAPAEIAEADLRQMLYVDPVSA